MFFLAYKAMTIGADVAEMKELLKDLRRGPRGIEPAANPFPAPLDDYETAESSAPEKFVLPPPISRRLDAERGIRHDADDDLSYGVRASERQH